MKKFEIRVERVDVVEVEANSREEAILMVGENLEYSETEFEASGIEYMWGSTEYR